MDHSEYAKARASLLAEEKAITRQLEQLAAKRRALPRIEIQDPTAPCYTFIAADGTIKTLVDLFEGRQQLIMYHFMLDSNEPVCPSCSFLADSIPHGEALNHLHSKSVTFCIVGAANIDIINSYRKRMGWTFPFYSSKLPELFKNAEEFSWKADVLGDEPYFGFMVFMRDPEDEKIYLTYQTTRRGTEVVLGTYALLDMTPLGRREQGKGKTEHGFRRHDEYGSV